MASRPPDGGQDPVDEAWADGLLQAAEALAGDEGIDFDVSGAALRGLLAGLAQEREGQGRIPGPRPRRQQAGPEMPDFVAGLGASLLEEGDLEPWELEAMLEAEEEASVAPSAPARRSRPVRRLPRASDGRSAVSVARRCVREAAALARGAFRGPHAIGVKGRGNILTETDLEVEARIIAALADAFPGHRVLSEETQSRTPAEGWVWVIDPIDGTKNFATGVPFFAVTLALCLDGEPLLGLTYDVMRREEFLAVRDRGLHVDGRPGRASTATAVYEGVVGFGLGFDDQRGARTLDVVRGLWPHVQDLRDLGSAALGLAYAACGRFDLFIHNGVAPWDIAAGLLLVREGGGAVTDFGGGEASLFAGSVVAGGAAVHADFLRGLGI
jgi:fructose-1,6-bisphosphatase/inositol monophosphatase family enzyme